MSFIPEKAGSADTSIEMVRPDGNVVSIPHTKRVGSGDYWQELLRKGFRFKVDVDAENAAKAKGK